MWPSFNMSSTILIITVITIVFVTESTGASVAPSFYALPGEDTFNHIATNQLAILSLINEVRSPRQESESDHSAMLDQLQEVRENLEEMRSNEMEKEVTINNTFTTLIEEVARLGNLHGGIESESDHSGMMEQLQEVRENLEEMRSNEMEKEVTFNNTLTTLQEEMVRHSSLHRGKGCESGGAVYYHGEITHNECYPFQCINGNMSTYINHTEGNPCVAPFEPLLNSCYYFINTPMTWCEGRQRCQRLGGDLAMKPDFTIINAYASLKTSGRAAWVGIRDNIWLTGQEPREEDWATGEPDAEDSCAFIENNKLHGWSSCGGTALIICQLF